MKNTKTLLSTLSVLTLGTTVGNFTGVLNTNIQKTNTLNNLTISQIKCPISTMTTDKNGNIYAGNWSGNDNHQTIAGTVYKCLAKKNQFCKIFSNKFF